MITDQVADNLRCFSAPCRPDGIILCMCLAGELHLEVNLQRVTVSSGSLLLNLPESLFKFIGVSEDFRGYLLFASLEFIVRFPIDYHAFLPFSLSGRSFFPLDGQQRDTLSERFASLYDAYERSGDREHDKILLNRFEDFSRLVGELLEEMKPEWLRVASRERYYYHFIQLVASHFRENRDVFFYADELCITRKYLTALVKEISDKCPSEWIEEFVVAESKAWLRYSDKSVAEIASRLNFPNPSFFGKYFKKYAGMTPGQFRHLTQTRLPATTTSRTATPPPAPTASARRKEQRKTPTSYLSKIK